jgi:hypothetical protein
VVDDEGLVEFDLEPKAVRLFGTWSHAPRSAGRLRGHTETHEVWHRL